MRLITLLLILFLAVFSSCSNDSEAPIDPLGVDGNNDLNPGNGNSDDQNPGPGNPTPTPNPGPTPGPTPPSIVNVSLNSTDINEKDTILVYKKFVKPLPPGTPREDDNCSEGYENQCVINRQIIFQFDLTNLNNGHPQELWDVTNVELKADYFSTGDKNRTELICLVNEKICSGKAKSKVLALIRRNSKFWTKKKEEIVINEWFHQEFYSGQVADDFFIKRDLVLNLTRHLNVSNENLQTIIRKNESLQFNVSDDTYVEAPVLQVTLKRRVPAP